MFHSIRARNDPLDVRNNQALDGKYALNLKVPSARQRPSVGGVYSHVMVFGRRERR